jgi:hypothetical protein
MDRVILVGAEDVARAGFSISAASDQMQRAAETISQALDADAARRYEESIRESQFDPNGKTLRDELAMHAMQAFVSRWGGCDSFDEGGSSYARVSEHSYGLADAMLKARSA